MWYSDLGAISIGEQSAMDAPSHGSDPANRIKELAISN
jgi:hypothetical protein